MEIQLYQLKGCPFCEKVEEHLDALDLEFETIWVNELHSQRNEVKRISGQRHVPVIVDQRHGVTMAESANIVEYLDHTYA